MLILYITERTVNKKVTLGFLCYEYIKVLCYEIKKFSNLKIKEMEKLVENDWDNTISITVCSLLVYLLENFTNLTMLMKHPSSKVTALLASLDFIRKFMRAGAEGLSSSFSVENCSIPKLLTCTHVCVNSAAWRSQQDSVNNSSYRGLRKLQGQIHTAQR